MRLFTTLTLIICFLSAATCIAGFFLVPKMLGGLSKNLSTIIFFKPDYPADKIETVKKEIQENYPEIATGPATPRNDTVIDIPGMKMPQSLTIYTANKGVAESIFNKYKSQEGVLEAYYSPEPFDLYNEVLWRVKTVFGVATGVFALLFILNLPLKPKPLLKKMSIATIVVLCFIFALPSPVFATQNMDKLVELEQKLKSYQEKLTEEKQTGEGLKDSLDYINTLIEYSNAKLAVSQENLTELSRNLDSVSKETLAGREQFTKTLGEVTTQKEELMRVAQKLYILSLVAKMYPQKVFDFGLYKSAVLNNLPFIKMATATGTALEEKKVLYDQMDQKILALKTDIQTRETEISSYNSQVLGLKTVYWHVK